MELEEVRLKLVKEYENASDDAVFSQVTVAAVRRCSLYTVERDRWAGKGVPFRKMGRSVRYYKCDIKQWLENHPALYSTSQEQYPREPRKSKALKENTAETPAQKNDATQAEESEENNHEEK